MNEKAHKEIHKVPKRVKTGYEEKGQELKTEPMQKRRGPSTEP